jgi:hypothetical protein
MTDDTRKLQREGAQLPTSNYQWQSHDDLELPLHTIHEVIVKTQFVVEILFLEATKPARDRNPGPGQPDCNCKEKAGKQKDKMSVEE